MAPVKIPLFVAEYRGMITFLYDIKSFRFMPIDDHTVVSLALTDYMMSLRRDRVLAWLDRSTKREYPLKLSPTVALAFQKTLSLANDKSDDQLMFLLKLNIALTDYSMAPNQHINHLFL